ncbi:hypothetical protein QF042_000108 [Pedobacter sp. W3I1]|nr:hypothetical protein [Pedobacter sp. W3I1]
MIVNYIYRIVLLIALIVIWSDLYYAHISGYDENYGYFINAILISSVLTITMIIAYFVKIKKEKIDIISSIIFLVLASPVTIIAFIWLYQSVVGQYFKL